MNYPRQIGKNTVCPQNTCATVYVCRVALFSPVAGLFSSRGGKRNCPQRKGGVLGE